jgi:hypothetical protein
VTDETKFYFPCSGGYALILSFLPGTGLDDVPPSLVREKANESLPGDTLEKLRHAEKEIEQIRSESRLITNPDQVTQLMRLEIKLIWFERERERYLSEPRNEVAQQLGRKAFHHYCDYLNGKLAGLKKGLPQTRHPDIAKYFARELHDRRYLGYSFDNLIPSNVLQQLNMSFRAKADSTRKEAIPSEFLRYVTYTWKAYLFALPFADYSVERGVPCLNLFFDLWVVLEIELRQVVRAKDTFYGYEIGYELVVPTDKELMGVIYAVFQPDPSYCFWQAIPLSLIRGLLIGQLVPSGAKVTGSSSNETVYEAEGFKIPIPDDFRNYLAEVGKRGGLEALGIIDPKTARIIEQLPSSEISTACGPDVEAAITKLVEMGWTSQDAKRVTESITFPGGATAEDIVKIILGKSYSKR